MREQNNVSNHTPAQDQSGQQTQEQGDLPSLSEVHERFVPTIKNIRLGLRRLWAQCLVKSLAQAVWTNSINDWIALQMLAKCTLCRQVRGGKSHRSQRMEWTRGRLQRWLAGERGSLWQDLPIYRRPQTREYSGESAKIQQQQRCIALTSEGGYSNACKALTSPAPLGQTAETTAQLREKHPSSSRPIDLSTLGNSSSTLVPTITAVSAEESIRSFHRLSGGGPSGLRPIHLKNCLSTEHRDEFVERCTALVNLLAKGDAPESLAPFLAGGNLTALPKKDNGIRPVAVGEVWRRLTAKCLCNEFKEQTSAYFFPQQIGVGQPRGTEIGLETARQWCSRNCNNLTSVFVKVDFTNAFNCVNRQAFLEQCRHNFPGLSPWAEWCYIQPSNLYFGTHSVASESGVQQGDPLGPLLFALALQPLLIQLHEGISERGLQLAFSYLDDLILAGDQQEVAGAFHSFKNAASQIGLQFNTSKCEVIPAAGSNSTINRSLFPSEIKFRDNGDFELLGGPIGSEEFCNTHTQERVNKAIELLTALGELPDPQVALTLVRQCASFGKLVYSLRVTPHKAHATALHSYDSAVRDCVESFMCCSFSDGEWSLARLSTKMGGLGLRSCKQHSPAAFLSSQLACHDLCRELDPHYTKEHHSTKANILSAIVDFNSNVTQDQRLEGNIINGNPRQQALSQEIDRHNLVKIREEASNNVRFQAHLNHTSASGAGAWLHAVPSNALKTAVDPLLFRTMIQRWLRVPIYDSESHCPFCDEVMDQHADHCLTCACGGDRVKRHNLLRNEVFYFCNSAGLNPELERPGLLQPRPLAGSRQEDGSNRELNKGRRPADIYLPRWRRGTPAALDFAVTSGLRSSIVDRSAVDGSAPTTTYEDFKRSHMNTENACQEEGITFLPVICEADGGGWGPAAHKVWSELAKHKALASGELNSIIVSRLLQSLGLILHRENAHAILRRSPNITNIDCRELLAASVACI